MKNWSYTIREGEHAGKTLWSGRYCAIAAFVFCKIDHKWCVLANKRGPGTPDFQGMWNCTCGYLEPDETAEQGCSRETLEETGFVITPDRFQLAGVETSPETSNNGNVTLRYFAFLEEMPEKTIATGGEENEVDEVRWIPLTELNNYAWAFNHRTRIYDIFQQWSN